MSNTSQTQIEELRGALSSMVSKTTPLTSKAQIAALLSDVEAAQGKGFNLTQIHTALSEAGLDMTFSTFKHNLYLIRKEKKESQQ